MYIRIYIILLCFSFCLHPFFTDLKKKKSMKTFGKKCSRKTQYMKKRTSVQQCNYQALLRHKNIKVETSASIMPSGIYALK